MLRASACGVPHSQSRGWLGKWPRPSDTHIPVKPGSNPDHRGPDHRGPTSVMRTVSARSIMVCSASSRLPLFIVWQRGPARGGGGGGREGRGSACGEGGRAVPRAPASARARRHASCRTSRCPAQPVLCNSSSLTPSQTHMHQQPHPKQSPSPCATRIIPTHRGRRRPPRPHCWPPPPPASRSPAAARQTRNRWRTRRACATAPGRARASGRVGQAVGAKHDQGAWRCVESDTHGKNTVPKTR